MNPGAPAGPVLRDIHMPPAPGWWPPAPGWWLVAIVAVALAAWCIVQVARKWRRRRYRRAVLRELDACIDGARGNNTALAAALSHFLRRLCKRSDAAAAALAGEAWLAHLDRAAACEEFTRGIGRVLIEAPYRPAADYDAAALIALVRRWTRRALQPGAARA